MTTLTLELTDEQAALLAEEAARLSLPMQEIAARRLFSGWQSTVEESGGIKFEDAADYVFQKNDELYERFSGRKECVSQAIGRIISENEELCGR